jgi:predicted dehydrogenase
MNSSDFTRRRFLKVPAAAAAVTAAPAVLPAQSPNDTVRVAVIGVGNRGSHLLGHMIKVPGVKVVAICDLDAQKLQSMAAAHAGQQFALYEDFRKMLDERKDIDAVVVATPTDTHMGIAIAVLEAGKHIYAEKPMAFSPEECRTVLNATRSAKGIYQSGFQLRHDPKRRAAMDFVLKGGIGKVIFLQGYRHTGDLPRQTAWYFRAERSGDNIVEQACHILDLMTWAAGKPPLRAYGSGGINLYKDVPPGRTTMDNYVLMVEFPDDIRLSFSHIFFDPPGFSGIKERVYGSNGAIDLATATWIEREKKGEIKLDVPNAGGDMNYLSLVDFIENARGRKTPLNSAESARISTLVAMMGRKAIYEKRIVTWQEVDV